MVMVFVTETDKSSRLCLDTLQEYVAMAEPHIRKDKVVTDKDVASIEKLMNCHSYQLCRIFGVCTAWDDGKRVKAAMTNKNLPPPSLKLSHKDHKPILPGNQHHVVQFAVRPFHQMDRHPILSPWCSTSWQKPMTKVQNAKVKKK